MKSLLRLSGTLPLREEAMETVGGVTDDLVKQITVDTNNCRHNLK